MRAGHRWDWAKSATCGITCSRTSHGSRRMRRSAHGPTPLTGACFRRARGSCRTSAHSLANWTRFLDSGDPPDLLRLRQHARAGRGWCGNHACRSRARSPGHRIARVVRRYHLWRANPTASPSARSTFTRSSLALLRGTPRRRGDDDRSCTRGRAAGRDPESLRPALLGAASPHAGHRCGARSGGANEGFSNERSHA